MPTRAGGAYSTPDAAVSRSVRRSSARDSNTHSLDIQQNAAGTVEFIGALDAPLPDALPRDAFALVLCTEVLEHVTRWDRAFANLASLLASGGRAIVTSPFVYPLHEEPHDYWRPTPHAMRNAAESHGLHVVEERRLGNGWDVLGTGSRRDMDVSRRRATRIAVVRPARARRARVALARTRYRHAALAGGVARPVVPVDARRAGALMTKNKPRVAVVQLISPPGGSQNLWVHAFMDPRFAAMEKHVLLPAGGVTRLSAEDRASAGITLHEFGSRTEVLAQRALRPLRIARDPLWRALDRVEPDLVWFNLAGLGELGWIGAAARGCRDRGIPYWLIVQHVHEHFFFLGDTFTDDAREIARAARRVLVVSERNRRALAVALGEELANVERAVNGVPRAFLDTAGEVARTAPPSVTGTAYFLSPARFDPPYKGQHLLLEAFAGEQWKERDWHLTLLGGGDHVELLGRLVAWFGLPAKRVTIAPHTNDVLGAFGSADVIVMPSLSEGSPFALVEGMACGRPAVGTPIGGIDEYVKEGTSGWLARSTEREDIAAALERCWNDRAAWPARGRAAHAIVAGACDLQGAHERLLSSALADARTRS